MYVLGNKSRGELHGVHPNVVITVEKAIKITVQDFSVFDGLRTLQEQREYVLKGVSRTMRSKHLKQDSTGFGHAVDLVPYINGKLRWEVQPCLRVAEAMHEAATELDVRLRWGAVWDREFLELDRTDLEGEVEAYVGRRRAMGKRAFLDYPHWELIT